MPNKEIERGSAGLSPSDYFLLPTLFCGLLLSTFKYYGSLLCFGRISVIVTDGAAQATVYC